MAQPLANSVVTALTGNSGLILASLAGSLPQAALHANDTALVDIHAEGTVRNGSLRLAKPARLSAGLDWIDMSLFGLNLTGGDTTAVTVSRDLVQSLSSSQITVAGPGQLAVTAGRDIDLGASRGITTTGNVSAPTLPPGGASVRLVAAAEGTLDLASFAQTYLDSGSAGANPRAGSHRAQLLAFVREALGQPALGDDEAWSLFQTFPAQAQAAVGRRVLAAEFNAVYLAGAAPARADLVAALSEAFERNRLQAIAGIDAALAQGEILRLPGVAANANVAQALAALPPGIVAALGSDTAGLVSAPATDARYVSALRSYRASLVALRIDALDIDAFVTARLASLTAVRNGWRERTAASLGSTAAQLDALAQREPANPLVLAYRQALADSSSQRFLQYRDQAMASEVRSAAQAGSSFGAAALPMRHALLEQALQAAELAGVGSALAQSVWRSPGGVLQHGGALDLTQSSVVTERGGDISLVNAGGAINVGLKSSTNVSAKGVIARGGGDIFGFANNDFQVNTQRVFVVGSGDMTIWSTAGDIDSGRGANTAVAAPPLEARRTVDGVVFETPATTTGSGLGILEDAAGRRSGTIGLFPAFGEILATDAFIRAPSVTLGATVRGADNVQSTTTSGAAAPVAAPPLAVAAPSSTAARSADAAVTNTADNAAARVRAGLLTVELLGLGEAAEPADQETCSAADDKANKCKRPAKSGAAPTTPGAKPD